MLKLVETTFLVESNWFNATCVLQGRCSISQENWCNFVERWDRRWFRVCILFYFVCNKKVSLYLCKIKKMVYGEKSMNAEHILNSDTRYKLKPNCKYYLALIQYKVGSVLHTVSIRRALTMPTMPRNPITQLMCIQSSVLPLLLVPCQKP